MNRNSTAKRERKRQGETEMLISGQIESIRGMKRKVTGEKEVTKK